MAVYTVELDGKQYDIEGDREPTEKETRETVAQFQPQGQPQGQVQQQPQQQTTADVFGDTALTQAILSPLTAVAKGLYKGAGSFYGKLDAVTQLLSNITGGRIKRGGLFGDISKEMDVAAEKLPDPEMHPALNTIYEMVGGAVPIVTEFAMGGKALKAAKVPQALSALKLEPLTETAKFSLIQALEEYKQNPEYKSLATGAARGAMVQMSFGVALKGMKLLWQHGKNTAQSYITWITNNKKLAKDFVDNPRKYNLNPWGKVRTFKEVEEQHNRAKIELDSKFKLQKEVFKDRTKREQQLLDIKLKDSRIQTKETLIASKEALQETSKRNLDDVVFQGQAALEQQNKAIKNSLVKTYDDALVNYKNIKQKAGEEVRLAIDSTLKQNPNTSISYDKVSNRFGEVLKESSPFKISKKAVKFKDPTGLKTLAMQKGLIPTPVKTTIESRTAAANQRNASVFQNIYDEFTAKGKEGKISIGYLQDLKSDLKVLSQKAYNVGDNNLGIFYNRLSKAVDPAKIIAGDAALSKQLSKIAQANKTYSSVLPRYEESMRQFFKLDSQGNPVPNLDKAIGAAQKRDMVALRQMKNSDSLLPPEDRILPKVEKIVSEMDKNIIDQKAMIHNFKRKAILEQKKLQQATRETMNRLQQKHTQLRTENKERIIRQVRDYSQAKNDEYQRIIDNFNSTEEFFKNQDAIRNVPAAWGKGAGIAQRLLGFYGVGTAFAGMPKGYAALGAAAALSPLVAGAAIKPVLLGTETVKNMLAPILKDERVQQAIGKKILQQLIK